MSDNYALNALVRRCGELHTERSEAEKVVKGLVADIKTIERAIQIIDPDYDLGDVKPRKRVERNPFFKHGESTRFILDSLRESDRPLSTIELATMAAEAKGLELDRGDRRRLDACILTAVSRQRQKGVVKEVGRAEDGTIEWKLA